MMRKENRKFFVLILKNNNKIWQFANFFLIFGQGDDTLITHFCIYSTSVLNKIKKKTKKLLRYNRMMDIIQVM